MKKRSGLAALLLLLIMLAPGTLAEDLPSGLPEGLSFYAEPGFVLEVFWPMEDGTVVLCGSLMDSGAALAVCLEADGAVRFRIEEASAGGSYGAGAHFLLYGQMPDGRLLMGSWHYKTGELLRNDWRYLDPSTGEREAVEALNALSGVQWVRVLPEGFLLCEQVRDEETGAMVSGDVVMLDFDFRERGRDAQEWLTPRRTVEVSPDGEGGVFLFGSNSAFWHEGEGASRVCVSRLGPDGQEVWRWEDTPDRAVWASRAAPLSDGGALVDLVIGARAYEEPRTTHVLLRLDAGGHEVSRQAWDEESIIFLAQAGEGAVATLSMLGGTAIVRLSEDGREVARRAFGSVGGRNTRVWTQLYTMADGTVFAAGSILTVNYENPTLESPFGVVYGVIDDAFFDVGE